MGGNPVRIEGFNEKSSVIMLNNLAESKDKGHYEDTEEERLAMRGQQDRLSKPTCGFYIDLGFLY